MLKQGSVFSLRDKWLFEITEVEITRVDCKLSLFCRELMHGDERNTLLKRDAEKFKEEQDRIDAERAQMTKVGDVKGFQKIIQESDVAKPPAVL